MFSTHAPRPLLWRALATNSAVLTAATLVLAVSPATVSFPIAVAEAFVLAGGLAAMVAVNLAVLPRAAGSAPEAGPAPSETRSRRRVGPVLVCWTAPHRLTVVCIQHRPTLSPPVSRSVVGEETRDCHFADKRRPATRTAPARGEPPRQRHR